MVILTPTDWQDYQLLDSGDGERLERWGDLIARRPDPQAIWKKQLPDSEWKKAGAEYIKKNETSGKWHVRVKLPERWQLHYKNLKFWAKLTPFKHTGIFPEQAVQWNWMTEILEKNPGANVLNLFGYTGIATIAAAAAGAKVTHVDASKPSISWARDNQQLTGLNDKPIRWILDDVLKFCQREVRRGVKYDAIIMDPPIYGHGPSGETWKFHQSFPELLKVCQELLSEKPLFIIVNAYAISASALMLENLLNDYFGNLNGTIEVGELALQQKDSSRLLSTGIFGRWKSVDN